jgi:glycosyltransferase involved in cell wall biosynthesis
MKSGRLASAVSASLWRHRGLVQALQALIKEEGITHLHSATGDLPGLIVATVAQRCGLTYSVDFHARDIHCNKYSLRRLLGKSRFVTVCNRHARDVLIDCYPSVSSQCHLVHHGVCLEDWSFEDPMTWRQHRPLKLLFVGRLVPKKGVEQIPLLIHALQEKGISCHGTIVGDGPLRSDLEGTITRLGLESCMTLAGAVERDGVRQFMQQVHMLVVPSIVDPDGDRDGVPNVVVEAMALGLPVVATQAGGLGELVVEEHGWVAASSSVDELLPAVEGVIANEAVTLVKALDARRYLERHFNARRCIMDKVDLFADCGLPLQRL